MTSECMSDTCYSLKTKKVLEVNDYARKTSDYSRVCILKLQTN